MCHERGTLSCVQTKKYVSLTCVADNVFDICHQQLCCRHCHRQIFVYHPTLEKFDSVYKHSQRRCIDTFKLVKYLLINILKFVTLGYSFCLA